VESEEGFVVHASLAAWLRDRWTNDGNVFAWSTSMLDMIEFATFNGGDADRYEKTLRNVLEAFEAVGLDLAGRVPQNVLNWFRYGFAL
jgi:hypothetical protein